MPSQKPPSEEAALELGDTVLVETTDGDLEFEVVGLVDDQPPHVYAVLYCENEDEFVVADREGNLLEDDEHSQAILDRFLAEVDTDEGEEDE